MPSEGWTVAVSEVPLSAVEAEEAVLGAILICEDVIPKVKTALSPEDFYSDKNRFAYEAMLELYHKRTSVDNVTLARALEEKGQMDNFGGPAWLTGLMLVPASFVHVLGYAEQVREAAVKRRLIGAAQEIVREAHDDMALGDLVESTRRRGTAAMPQATNEAHLSGDQAQMTYLELASKWADEAAREDTWIVTGWPDVDSLLAPFEPGMLSIWAGTPGVGKTIALECIAEHNAQRGRKVAFYHMELSHQVMLARRMARYSGVPYQKLRRGYMGEEVHKALDAISSWQGRITYIYCSGWTAAQIVADLERLHFEGQADMAIVDYLQTIQLPDQGGMNESSLIGQAIEELKICGARLAIPIFLGCQVNRMHNERADGKPHLSELRKSGEIEEKANQVVFLHRRTPKQGEDANVIEVYAEKNTLGPLGEANLLHQAGQFRFVSADMHSTEFE